MNIGGILKEYIAVLAARLTVFDNACPKESIEVPLDRFGEKLLERFYFAGAEWELDYDIENIDKWKDIFDISVSLRVLKGTVSNVSLSIVLRFNGWDRQNYVFIPGAVYGGNREIKITSEQLEIAKLSKSEPESCINILSSDCTTPCAGFYSEKKKYSFLLFTELKTKYGLNGISVEEDMNKMVCEYIISTPGIKNTKLAEQKGADIDEGKFIALSARCSFSHSNNLQQLFEQYLELRNDYIREPILKNTTPFSEIYKRLLENLENVSLQNPLYILPASIIASESFEKGSIDTLNNIFNNQLESGFLHSEDNRRIDMGQASNILYSLVKAVYIISKKDELLIQPNWIEGLRRKADALVKIWEANNILGQIVDIENGSISGKGSATAAILPAALCIFGKLVNEAAYVNIAELMGEYLYTEFIKGGSYYGNFFSNNDFPDSYAIYSILESFTTLYENTIEQKWLSRSCEAAAQFSTWCVNYDSIFSGSTFKKEGTRNAGTIIGDIQNKYVLPCIPNFSGIALLRLFKYADDKRYFDLLRLTAHNMAHKIREIDIEESYLKEACEVSAMLTYTQIPGLYVQPEAGIVFSIDNIDAKVLDRKNGKLRVVISNPTNYMAKIRVMVDAPNKLMDEADCLKYKYIELYPNETKVESY